MNVINNEKMHYDAFISYRHSELDKFVAEELHKQLETFKVPKKIAKKCGKKKINRIFRDKDELPITSNLEDPIINALRESEFLIVICSPRLNESLWCKREIENFIAMHGQENVLAVLVEGEPSESFPQELLYRDRTVTLENGETKVVKEAVEPLAADVRGKNKKEIKKLIKLEMLRLLASMLHCNYDDLRQRHKERKMQRTLALASIVCFVGLSFGTVSTIMALQIHKQKEQIDKQYWEVLETNAKMSSENALELLEAGDRIGAITVARELLPENLKNQEIPYTSEAFFALTQSLYPYATGDILQPVFQIKANAEISEIKLSDDWDKIYIRTKYDQLMVWDIPNKKKCLDINMSQMTDYSVYDYGITFVGSDKIALLTYEEIMILDLLDNEEGKIGLEIDCGEYKYPREILSNADGKYIVVIYEQAVCAYDTNTGEKITVFEMPENMEIMTSRSVFYGQNKIIFCSEPSDTEETSENILIYLADLETGEIINTYEVPYGSLVKAMANSDSLFVAVNGVSKEITGFFDTADDADIYCFDLNSGAKRWEYHVEEEFINSIVIPYEGYDCFLFESYAQITALEAKTGELIGRFGFGSSIVNVFPLETPDNYIVFTRDGGRTSFIPEENYNVEVAGRFISATDNIKQFEWGNGFFVALPYASKEVIVYEWYQDDAAETLLEFEQSVADFVLSGDEKYSAVELYSYEILIVDNEAKEIIGQVTCDSYSKGLHFIGNDKIQRISNDEVYTYDLQGNLLEQYKLSEEYLQINQVSIDGKYAFGDDYEAMYAINCRTKEVEKKLLKEQCDFGENTTYTFSNSGDICVILDKTLGQCRSYDVSAGTMLATIDINATYVEYVHFSENDKYVYIIYEDGMVCQYISENLTFKCQVKDLEYVTDVIYEKVIYGETKYYFSGANGAYVLGDYDGQLKVEQFVPLLKAVHISGSEYWVIDYKTLIAFPIYTYEEILGKADQICYDNSLWDN